MSFGYSVCLFNLSSHPVLKLLSFFFIIWSLIENFVIHDFIRGVIQHMLHIILVWFMSENSLLLLIFLSCKEQGYQKNVLEKFNSQTVEHLVILHIRRGKRKSSLCSYIFYNSYVSDICMYLWIFVICQRHLGFLVAKLMALLRNVLWHLTRILHGDYNRPTFAFYSVVLNWSGQWVGFLNLVVVLKCLTMGLTALL